MKNRNILLINPWIYDFAAYDLWIKPLGLLYLASVFRRNGYQITYLDLLDDLSDESRWISALNNTTNLKLRAYGQKKFHKQIIAKPVVYRNIPRRYGRYGISEESFLAQLNRVPAPAVVLVTSIMTYWYPGVVHVIKLVKDKFPQVPVILGGIYATLCHDHAVTYSGADYVLPGESEIECVRLVDKLTGNQSSCYPDQTDLDSYPYPAFDLLRKISYICILTSRGCPYRCRYCASQLISPQWRRRKPELVVAEIEYWHGNYGVRNFVFYDDALTFDLETHFIPLLEMMITKNLDLNFHTPNGIHARGISNKVAWLMHRAGFKTIRLGLESCDATFQSTTGNKITTAEFQNTVMNLRHAGYSSDQIGVYLLAGLPNQSVEEVEKSVRFVQSSGARPYLSEYSPIPGTALWKQAVAVSPFDIASDPLWHNNSIFPCQWSGFTVDQLHQVKLLLHNKSR